MSGIYGLLGLEDNDTSYVNTIGQRIVFDAVTEYVAALNAELEAAQAVLISEETEEFKMRYKLPGGGTLDRVGLNSKPGATGQYGGWDVAFPLESFAKQIAASRINIAAMTVQQLQAHLDTIQIQNANTVFTEALRAIFRNTNRTFIDDEPYKRGTLTCVPLANGDSVVYPPLFGETTEATENHYLESNYTAANISDTNNPLVTIRDEIEEHNGAPTGGSNIAVFINRAQRAKVEALTDFDPVEDRFIRSGQDTDVPVNLPNVPGTIIGRCDGTWVVVWPRIPANYMLGVDLDTEAPLKMRRDPRATGLPWGLTLVSESDAYPLQNAYYENRFGIAVANRLGAVVMELGTGGSYTIPTAFA
jgi:hypothetical protein